MTTHASGITFLIGGARSGKSALAVQIAKNTGQNITFLATGQAFDEEMAQRISIHRAERPQWTTIEEPIHIDYALAKTDESHLVILDCITLWVSNMLMEQSSDERIYAVSDKAIGVAKQRKMATVVVSNEVGLGLVPGSEMERHFRDVHGRVNQQWATAANHPLFVIAGMAIPLHRTNEMAP